MSYLVTATTVVDASAPLTVEQLAQACGAHVDWVRQLVDAGIVQMPDDRPPTAWLFHSEDLRQALEARRLQRDFDATLDAAALMLDMGREIRRLRALLAAHGVSS
ncbi:MerR family transcriptional regulator [Xylophilus sp. Kf1]|nr:MerR family transcriptional regulator [Xylophilus sp. Kf1]